MAGLADLLVSLQGRLQALETGAASIVALEAETAAARVSYDAAAVRLTRAREAAAERLVRAVGSELPPLRLDRARFFAEVVPLPEEQAGPLGMELSLIHI